MAKWWEMGEVLLLEDTITLLENYRDLVESLAEVERTQDTIDCLKEWQKQIKKERGIK